MIRAMRALTLLMSMFLCFSSQDGFAQSAYTLFKEGKDYRKKGKKNKAIKSFEEALDKAESSRNQQLQMSCHIELVELKDNVINYKEAHDHYKAFTKLYKKQLAEEKDEEISNKEEELSTLTEEKLQTDLDNADLELQNKESANRRNVLIGIIAISVIILGLGYVRKRRTNLTLRNKNYQIAKKKEKKDIKVARLLQPLFFNPVIQKYLPNHFYYLFCVNF